MSLEKPESEEELRRRAATQRYLKASLSQSSVRPVADSQRSLKTEHDYFVLTLERRVADFYSKTKSAQREPSSENLRRLRVAARRLNAGLSLIQQVAPCKGLNWTRTQIKTKLKPLGELRDVQLFLQQASSLSPQDRDLRKYCTHLEKRLQKLEREANKAINSLLSEKLSKRIRSAQVKLKRKKIDTLLLHRVHLAFADSFSRVEDKRIGLKKKKPSSYHDLRVAFKKYRYTAEILAPFYPRIVKETLDQMKLLQRKFGALQDADALLQDMRKFVKTKPKRKDLLSKSGGTFVRAHSSAFTELKLACEKSPLLKRPVYSTAGVFKLIPSGETQVWPDQPHG